MRNLKKALSLALALVMLLGMMVVGAGAAVTTSADFSDNASIAENRKEAVDVMTALEVFQGDDDKKLNPEETLTREQAAAIVARMLLGSAADNLKATSSSYSDVATDRWSAGVIEYCTNMDILAGHAGKFDPAGELTNVAFAKMMLCALGYKADAEGFTGPNWAVNVATVARKAGIDVDLAVSSAAMSRQDAAQMAFNTLRADMVEYRYVGQDGFGNTITVTNKITEDYRRFPGNEIDVGQNQRDTILQFCEMYFKNLKYTFVESDNFGDMIYEWRLVSGNTTETITTFPVEPAQQYTELVTSGDIYSDLGLGRNEAPIMIEDGVNLGATAIARGNTTKIGGNGAVTKVWTNEYGVPTRITVINTYVGDISGVNSTTGAVTIAPRLVTETTKTYTPEEGEDELKVGDIVLYTMSGTTRANLAVQSVKKVETESGTLTGYTNRTALVNGNATLDSGTAVEYSEKIAQQADGASLRKSVTVVKDSYGYIIWVSNTASIPNFAYVIAHNTYALDTSRFQARLKLANGSEATWFVDSNVTGPYDGADTTLKDHLVSYKYNPVTGAYTLTDGGKVAAGVTANNVITYKNNPNVTAVGADGSDNATVTTGFATNQTVFFVQMDGLDNFEVYQGIAKVPTIVATGAVKTQTMGTISETDAASILGAVFIDARSNVRFDGDSSDVVYILGPSTTSGGTTVNGGYSVYTAAYKGVITDNFLANSGLTRGLYTYVKENPTTGVYTVRNGTTFVRGTSKVSNNAVNLGGVGYTWNANTSAYVVNEDRTSIDYFDVSNLNTDSNDFVWQSNVGGTLSVMVIEKNAGGTTTASLNVADAAIKVGQGTELSALTTWNPGTTGRTPVSYAYLSFNPGIATVNATGRVTGVAEGTALIRVVATLDDGTTIAGFCTITVEAGAGGGVSLPTGINAVDLTTPTAVTVTYDATANSGNRPTDAQLAKAIQAQLKTAGWDTPAASDFTMNAATIKVTAKKTDSDGFTTTQEYTLTKATGCLVKFKVNGTAITTAISDMTKVKDVSGLSSVANAANYIQITDGAGAKTYVAGDDATTTVKAGYDYDGTNKYYHVSLGTFAAATIDSMTFNASAVAKYMKTGETIDIIVTATAGTATSAIKATVSDAATGATTDKAAARVYAAGPVSAGNTTVTTTVTLTSATAKDIVLALALAQ